MRPDIQVERACHSLRQVVEARRDTVDRLVAGADYLDCVWLRCRVSRSLGTTTSLLGGGLTIAGGVLALATAGTATPLLLAGLATSSAGTAANIGTGLMEKVVNSRQVKQLDTAFERDREVVEKLAGQLGRLEQWCGREEGRVVEVTTMLGEDHLLLHLLREAMRTQKEKADAVTSTSPLSSPSQDSAPSAARTLLTQGSRDGLNVSLVNSGVVVESSKVIGQNSFKATGQVCPPFMPGFQHIPDCGWIVCGLLCLGRHRPGPEYRGPSEEGGQLCGQGAAWQGGHLGDRPAGHL